VNSISGISRSDALDGSLCCFLTPFFIAFPFMRRRSPGANDPDFLVGFVDENYQKQPAFDRLADQYCSGAL